MRQSNYIYKIGVLSMSLVILFILLSTYTTVYYTYLYLYILFIFIIYLYKNNITIILKSNTMLSIALYLKKRDGFSDKNTRCSLYIRNNHFIYWLQQCLSKNFNATEVCYAKAV